MEINQNSQGFDEKTLKSTHRQKELFSFSGKLARKGEPKRYSVEKRPAYYMNFFAIIGGNLFRVCAGCMAVFYLLKGVFALLGDFAGPLAGVITFVGLVLLESRQWHNATGMLERWFFQGELSRGHMGTAIFFSVLTLGLGIWGLPYTVAELSPGAATYAAKQIDPEAATLHLQKLVQDAERDAKDFRKSASWKGKLDPRNQGIYAGMLETAKTYRDSLTAAKREIVQKNREYERKAEAATMAAGAEKTARDKSYLFSLICLLIATELLFWLGFYHKERYEFFCTKEYEALGEIKRTAAPTLPAQRQPVFQQNNQGRTVIAGFQHVPQNDPYQNTVPQSSQTVPQINVIGSDHILKSVKSAIQRDLANFKNPSARTSTVAGRIHIQFADLAHAMQGGGFQPTPTEADQVYFYLVDEVIPTLEAQNAKWGYENQLVQNLSMHLSENARLALNR